MSTFGNIIWLIFGGLGTAIMSTSDGLITNRQAAERVAERQRHRLVAGGDGHGGGQPARHVGGEARPG